MKMDQTIPDCFCIQVLHHRSSRELESWAKWRQFCSISSGAADLAFFQKTTCPVLGSWDFLVPFCNHDTDASECHVFHHLPLLFCSCFPFYFPFGEKKYNRGRTLWCWLNIDWLTFLCSIIAQLGEVPTGSRNGQRAALVSLYLITGTGTCLALPK